MAPIYEPDFIFTFSSVVLITDCLFCTEPITPEINDWMVIIGLPGKNSVSTHPDCFEQLAWSMTNYVFANKGNLEPKRILN